MKNAEINNAARKKKAAEEEDERKKIEEATKITEDVSNKAATITPRNLDNVINGNDDAINVLEDNNDIAAIMDIDGADGTKSTDDTSKLSPVK